MVEVQSHVLDLCDASTSIHPLIEHVLTGHHSDLGLTCTSESPLSTDNLLTHLVDCDIAYIYINYGLFSIIIIKLNLLFNF